ncbi:MAG: DUF1415 family protein [Deltaproteobacteria bacterium]|nr:DUF1415 family protein [Nannocystaceae bacterium]
MHSGARQHDDDDGQRPTPAVVHAVHDRYLVEIVEELGLCPFARRSREQGRVHRPLWWVAEPAEPDPAQCAARLLAIVHAHPDAEILLPTFVVAPGHLWNDAESFASFVAVLRGAYEQQGGPRFFMVAFHPGFPSRPAGTRAQTADTLVPSIRRSPDPVIQCVSAEVLERARAQAQQHAHERLRVRFADDPVMRALIERSVQADSELSAEIARNNFTAVGTGAGREELDRRVADIARERDARYAR